MDQRQRRKLIEFLEAFVSPVSGLVVQMVTYMLMGVEMKEVSVVFMIVVWVVISAATAMAFERIEFRRG